MFDLRATALLPDELNRLIVTVGQFPGDIDTAGWRRPHEGKVDLALVLIRLHRLVPRGRLLLRVRLWLRRPSLQCRGLILQLDGTRDELIGIFRIHAARLKSEGEQSDRLRPQSFWIAQLVPHRAPEPG